MQCETYIESRDQQHIRKEWNGECKKPATRKVTTKQGKVIKLCGYCARGWRQSALNIEII